MEDYRVTQTGDEIQEILNQSPIDTADIAELKEAATSLDGRLESVEVKIPAGASEDNPLTDKQYVDDSIASASATFRGTYNEVTDLELTTEATHAEIGEDLASVIDTADSNDYCFVQIPTADATPTEIESIERYKFVTGTGWQYEYTLNNSGFTADQWAAINSGITSGFVAKLADLPANAELENLLNGKANAADVYTKSETYNKTELDAQLGEKANSADVYAKTDTYTKQEVDALITTPEVQYVTVTATSGTTSVTDVLPATGAANTIYRVGSWDGTQYATGVYSEYAWNGTTYILLDVKNYGFATGSDFDNPTTAQRELVTTVGSVLDGISEGVFDLTAKTGDSYATLADALTAANTSIPTNKKKGGMSIKFVQSSDHKYVQYPLDLSNHILGTETSGVWEYSNLRLLFLAGAVSTGDSVYVKANSDYRFVISGYNVVVSAKADITAAHFVEQYEQYWVTEDTYVIPATVKSIVIKVSRKDDGVISGDDTANVIASATCSSNNKYVQYKYIGTSVANNSFTNVNNWQTVDKVQIQQTYVTSTQLVGRTQELFELGNITGIENDGTLTYDDTNTKRVRLLKNTYLYFAKGDCIGLKDYTLNMRYFVIGIDNDGTTHNLGWKTADYVFEYSGRYGVIMDIVISNVEQTISDVTYLADNLRINPMDVSMNGNVQFLTGTLKPNIDSTNGTIQFYKSNLFIGNKRYVIPAQIIPLYVNDNSLGKSYMLVVNVKTGAIASRYVNLAVDSSCEAVLGNYVLNYINSTENQYTYWTFIKDSNFVFDYTIDGIDYMCDGREYESKYLADIQKTHGAYITDIKGFMSYRVKTSNIVSDPIDRLWVIIPSYKVAKVKVNALSDNYYWTINAFSNREDCIARFIHSLDGGLLGWQTTAGTVQLRYDNFYYLKLAFKRADDGELTAADFTAILNSINVEIWTGTAVDNYYQTVNSIYNDIYGTKITDISSYDHVLALGNIANDRLRFFIPASRDVTVTVGGLLSGFDWTINAFRSYQDAVDTVNPLDGGSLPWTSSYGTYTLAYDEMKYLRLNFKKTNNSAIRNYEVNNIIASIIITIIANSQGGIKKQVEYLSDNFVPKIDLSTAYLCDINNTNIGDYNLLGQVFRISPDSVITLKAKTANPVVTTHIDIGNDDLMYVWSKRIYKDLWSDGDKVVSNANYGGRIAMILFKKGDAERGSLSEPVTLADIVADYDLYISNLVPWDFSQNLTAVIGARASAHRGVQVNDIPQESNEAYMMAARCGFDECEADVCVTSDGKFVMSHDTTLSSTLIEYADGTQIASPIAINSLTFEQVRTNFRLKSNNPIYRQQIPSFEEYLKICLQYNIFAFPEIKNNPLSNALCEDFLNLCTSYLPKDKFAIQSWNYDALDYIRSLDEEVDLCYVDIDIRNTNNAVTGQSRFTKHTHAMFRESGATTNLSAEIVEAYRRNGSMVWDGTLVKPNMFSDSVQNNACPTVITETCGPNLLGRNGIHFTSKKGWDWFYTDGTIANGVLTLNTNQVLAFTTRFGYIGGIILDIKFKGAITIKSQQSNVNKGLNKTVISSDEFKHLVERVLVYNNTGSFYIKATADDTIIESIDFQYAELV